MIIKAQMIFFYFGSPISALNHFTLNLRFKISPDDKTLKRRKLRFCQKSRSQISLSVTVESKLGYLSDITSWWLCIVLSLSTSKVWIIRLDWNSDSKSISIFSFCWMLEIYLILYFHHKHQRSWIKGAVTQQLYSKLYWVKS